jgi:glycosyltransferase involved in cell wall biosynthesis
MIIGIDASRAFIKEKTGTENYASNLVKKLIELDKKNQYRLYSRKNIPWRRLWTQGGLALECLLHPPDILFIPAHTLPIIRRPSLKVIVTIHGLEYEYLPQYYQFPQKLYLNKSTEYAVSQANHLIAVSQWTKSQLVERLGADPQKITVIYEGVSVSHQSSVISHQSSKPYILFVGTVQPRKNLVRLIEAFSRLQSPCLAGRQVASNLYLKIAGKPGWLYDEILEAPKKFRVGKRVKFLGYVSDRKLASLYRQALCFVLPSLCEGFGLPVLEAMSYGCPVIASKAGALPEIVGGAGLLVDPYQVEELAGAMKLVVENRELREDLREKGFQRLKKFSWQKAAQKTIKVFEKVFNQA